MQTFRQNEYQYCPPSFTADGTRFITVSADATGLLFTELQHQPPGLILPGHTGRVTCVAISADQTELLTAGFDRTFRRWDQRSGLEQDVSSMAGGDDLLSIDYCPNTGRLATLREGTASLFNTDTGTIESEWKLPTGQRGRIAINPDGSEIAVASEEGSSIIDVSAGQIIKKRDTPSRTTGIAFLTDGTLAALEDSGEVWLWRYRSGEFQTFRPGRSQFIPRAIASLPRHNAMAIALGDRIEIWDAEQPRRTMTIDGVGDAVTCLTADAAGLRLFAGHASGRIGIVNLESGRAMLTLHADRDSTQSFFSRGSESDITALTLSRDQRTLVSASADGIVRVWETNRPSVELSADRTTVREARRVVTELAQRYPGQRKLLEALTADDQLPKDVLTTALAIAGKLDDEILRQLQDQHRRQNEELLALPERWVAATRKANGHLDAQRTRLVEAIGFQLGVTLDSPLDTPAADEADLVRTWMHIAHGFSQLQLTESERRSLLDPLVDAYPKVHFAHHLRGMSQAARGNWPEAYSDISRAIESVPEQTQLWFYLSCQLAYLEYHVGSFDQYESRCRRLLSDFGSTTDTAIAVRLARVCLLPKEPVVPVEQIATLVNAAMEREILPNDVAWLHFVAGVTELRRGNHEEAATAISNALSHPFKNDLNLLIRQFSLMTGVKNDISTKAEVAILLILRVEPWLLEETRAIRKSWESWIHVQAATRELREYQRPRP